MIVMARVKKLPGVKIVKPRDSELLYEASPKNPLWNAFTKYVKAHEISSLGEL